MNVILGLDVFRFLVAMFGVLWTSLELHDTVLDRRVLKKSGLNGAKLLVANSNVQNEALRLTLQFIFLFMATMGLISPLPTGGKIKLVAAYRLLFIVQTGILTWKSYIDRHVRYELLHHWLHEATLQRRRKTDEVHHA